MYLIIGSIISIIFQEKIEWEMSLIVIDYNTRNLIKLSIATF